jgi:hypothetical protein
MNSEDAGGRFGISQGNQEGAIAAVLRHLHLIDALQVRFIWASA